SMSASIRHHLHAPRDFQLADVGPVDRPALPADAPRGYPTRCHLNGTSAKPDTLHDGHGPGRLQLKVMATQMMCADRPANLPNDNFDWVGQDPLHNRNTIELA